MRLTQKNSSTETRREGDAINQLCAIALSYIVSHRFSGFAGEPCTIIYVCYRTTNTGALQLAPPSRRNELSGSWHRLRINCLVVHVGMDARVLAEIGREQESIVRFCHRAAKRLMSTGQLLQ
jgi:hypothetical protein